MGRGCYGGVDPLAGVSKVFSGHMLYVSCQISGGRQIQGPALHFLIMEAKLADNHLKRQIARWPKLDSYGLVEE